MKLEHAVRTFLMTYLESQKTLNEEDFRARIMEFEERRNKKLQLLQAENQDKDLEGCTF